MWTFEYADVLGGQFGVERVEFVGDTMVSGQLAQRLRETSVTATWGNTDYTSTSYSSLYTYLDNGVVYLWNGVNAYDTLMWFDAAPGQRWNAPENPDFGLVVLDTATVIVSGVPLKRLVVQSDLGWPLDTLYERIGFQFLYLAGWSWFLTDMPWNGLMCYQDDSFSFTMAGISDCDFTLRVSERKQGSSIVPFPNPGTDHFTVELPAGDHIIEIRDATGRCVRIERVSGERAVMDTRGLRSGIYFVAMRNDRAPMPVQRWVKN